MYIWPMAKSQIIRILDEQEIINKIYFVRGHKVMLDRDLAEIYGVETRILNQAVKRNSRRFPADFMFQMTDDELQKWKTQAVIPDKYKMGLRKLPLVFTEQGVTMLSCVLSSDKAIDVNIKIIRAFTKLRDALLSNSEILLKLEKLDKKIVNMGFDIKMHDGEIESLFELIKEIMDTKSKQAKPTQVIGFRTQATKNNNPEMKAAKPKTVNRK
jgi:hypothetical protein